MNPGNLRHTIMIQKRTFSGPDQEGNEKFQWEGWYQTHSSVNGLSGSEYWEAARNNAENTVIFTLRWCRKLEEITPQGYQILFQGRIYEIIAPPDHVQFQKQWIKIKAKTAVSEKVEGIGYGGLYN